jgi:hypothetical protein
MPETLGTVHTRGRLLFRWLLLTIPGNYGWHFLLLTMASAKYREPRCTFVTAGAGYLRSGRTETVYCLHLPKDTRSSC